MAFEKLDKNSGPLWVTFFHTGCYITLFEARALFYQKDNHKKGYLSMVKKTDINHRILIVFENLALSLPVNQKGSEEQTI